MKNNPIPLVMSRLFNVPIMIHEPKLDVIMWALKDRIGLDMKEPEAPEHYSKSVEAKAETRSGSAETIPTVAIIPVHDSLVHRHTMMQSYSGMTSYLYIRNTFRKAMASDDISAIILHIDSPGGEVAGVKALADEIYAARGKKPVYAAVDEHAFSAAYYIAAAAEKIFVPSSGGVGSVGVIARHLDQSAYNEKEGLKVTTVYAGARKNDLSPHEPITDESLATLREIVDEAYEQFTLDVAKYRGTSQVHIKETEAALYWGSKALKIGLADHIGTLDDAINEALDASVKNGARNITTGDTSRKGLTMEKFTSLTELAAEYPEYAAQLRQEGKDSIDLEGAIAEAVESTIERDLELAQVHFGAEAADKFAAIVRSGITADQYRAVVPEGTAPATSEAKKAEAQKMDEMLEAIQGTGKQDPGTGGEAEGPKDFISLVNAYREEHKCSKSKAISAVTKEYPELHEEYLLKAQKGGKE